MLSPYSEIQQTEKKFVKNNIAFNAPNMRPNRAVSIFESMGVVLMSRARISITKPAQRFLFQSC
jgi:hypothetical protein